MKKISTYLLVAVLTIFVVTVSQAGVDKLGQTGMPFLKMDVGGRASAMAAHCAVLNDATAMFSNLAGLAMVDGLDFMVNQTNWIADIKQYAGGVAYGTEKWGVFGLSFVYMDYGTFKETRPYDGTDPVLMNAGYEDLGDFEVGEYAIGLSYARRISSQFSIGGQIKYAKQDLYESLMYNERLLKEEISQNVESSFAVDFGTLYYTGWQDLRIAMSVRNFSQQERYVRQRFELPLMMNIGVAMDVMPLISGEEGDTKLTVAVDALHPRDYSERMHVGAEFAMKDMLFVRAGYKFNYDEEGLTAGIGLDKMFGNIGIKFDYAYGSFGDFFGEVHRISWGIYMK